MRVNVNPGLGYTRFGSKRPLSRMAQKLRQVAAQRLRQFRDAAELSREDLARLVKTHHNTIQKLENDERQLTVEWLERLARPLGREPIDFIRMDFAPIGKIGGSTGRFAFVSEVNVEASAGQGTLVESPSDNRTWAFPEHWLRAELDAAPTDIKIITIRGDSGQSDPPKPTDINPGDKVLVNIADRRPSPPGLFVIFDGLGLIAKRLEFIAKSVPPRLRISSNNPVYAPAELPMKDVDIQGRIVAKWQRLS